MRSPSSMLKHAVEAYRGLVRLYPAVFREQFGAHMVATFSDLAEEAVEQRGRLGLVLTWVGAVLELLRIAAQQHLVEAERRFPMLATSSRLPRACWVMVICLVIGMITTPPDPLSQLVVGLPLFCLYLALSTWRARDPRRQRRRA